MFFFPVVPFFPVLACGKIVFSPGACLSFPFFRIIPPAKVAPMVPLLFLDRLFLSSAWSLLCLAAPPARLKSGPALFPRLAGSFIYPFWATWGRIFLSGFFFAPSLDLAKTFFCKLCFRFFFFFPVVSFSAFSP